MVVLAAGGIKGHRCGKYVVGHILIPLIASRKQLHPQISVVETKLQLPVAGFFNTTNLPWVRWEVTFQVLEPFMYLFIKCAISYHGENFLIQGGVAIPSR